MIAASPAAAASGEYDIATYQSWVNGTYWCVNNAQNSAYGCLEVRGDYLQVGDVKADGRRTGMQWSTSGGRKGLCVNTAGKDFSFTPPTQQPSGKHLCNKDFGEGATITFRVGSCDASAHDCTNLANWSQWSDWISRKNAS
ncbi:hypothetical protein [Jatrophihabitans endophyticus]|nr:hypothetical protein [Jatrophihabitans endophyticus]